MKTALCLVTFNKWELTDACLQRLEPLGSEWEIVVADNGSTDGTPELIRQKYPFVKVCLLPDNRGFGFANNRAAEAAEGCDVLCFMNNDTLPNPEDLRRIESFFRNDVSRQQHGVVLSPRILGPDGLPQPNYYRDIPLWVYPALSLGPRHVAQTVMRDYPESSADLPGGWEVSWTGAVCWMMRRDTWDMLGGFDERIFMYWEDVDFAWRAHRRNVRFLIDPSAQLVHLDGGSARSGYDRARQNDQAQTYVFGKRWGRGGRLVSIATRIVRSLPRCLLMAIAGLFRRGAREQAVLHFRLLVLALNDLTAANRQRIVS